MAEKSSITAGFIARISMLTSLTALSIDAMLPALPAIGDSLVVAEPNNLQLVISLFFLGTFFGELFFGPFSDAVGRKKALGTAVAIYCFGAFVALTATSLQILLAGRIIQGIGVSGPKIISRAMIRDKYSGREMARVFSFIMTIFICVPMVAPALGQGVMLLSGWRAIFVVFILFAMTSYIWIVMGQEETLPEEKRLPFKVDSLVRTSMSILSHPVVLCYGITAGLIFGILLFYLSTSQAMFGNIYGKIESFPLYFAILAGGFGGAALLNSRLVMRYGMHRLVLWGIFGLMVTGLVFLFSSLSGGLSFFFFMVACFWMLFCTGVLFSNLSAMAMQPLDTSAGLGASIISAISTLIAVVVAVIFGRFFDDTLLPLSIVALVCSGASVIFVLLGKKFDPTKQSSEKG